jgi:hypothetical protein
MGKELDFLRMLEPLVRPGNLPAPSKSGGNEPVESQSFESLLERVSSSRQTDASQGVTGNAGSEKAASCDAGLTALSGIDKVENSALRELIAGRFGAGNGNWSGNANASGQAAARA